MDLLGIDIGGTKVALRVQGSGRSALQRTFTWPDPAGGVQADLAALAGALDDVRAAWSAPITAVGVALPVTVDARDRVTAWPNRPSWVGLDLRAALTPLLSGARLRWADDGDLAGLAEADAAGLADVVYLGVGTGIGGAVIVRGRCLPGLGRGSAEIGHLVLDRSGARCGCGRRGCLQAVASGPATIARAAVLRGTAVDYAALREGWGRGRPWAVQALTETADALAAAAVSLAEVLHPEAVVIGGGFVAGLPDIVDLATRHAAEWARPGHPAPAIRPALLGGLSSLHGAVLFAGLPADADDRPQWKSAP
jgi:kanosamine 6-kinase